MNSMEHAIEKAARIIHGCTGDEDGAPVAARALAEAGLLAPAPLTEEWGVQWADGHVWDAYKTREEATISAGSDPGDKPVHRHVTAWEEA